MKIALVRGDFASPWEVQNFSKIASNNPVTLFTGYLPVSNLGDLGVIQQKKLFSPADINFGAVSRWKMGVMNRVFGDAHFLLGLENELEGFDVAHVAETYYGYVQQSIQAKLQGKVKRVVSTVWENIPNNNEGISVRKNYKKNAFANIDLFLPVTRSAKFSLIKEGCADDKVVVLYPGIDLTNFYPAKKVNKKLELLFVGRLVEEKGLLLLLDTFLRNQKQLSNVNLTIVGTGPLKNYAENLIQKNNLRNISVMGSVSYKILPEIYRKSDVLVHPAVGNKTWVEQYGMVLIEGMASGLPILGVDRGSIKEIVGNAGMIVAPEDFSENLIKISRNRSFWQKFTGVARKRAVENFDAIKYSLKLEGLYKEVLS